MVDKQSSHNIVIMPQYDNKGILTSYLCSNNGRTVLVDLACLKSYPNNEYLPSICSWDGFEDEKKFCHYLYDTSVSIDMTIEGVQQLVAPYLTPIRSE